jgi:NAD-dependent deacetylase
MEGSISSVPARYACNVDALDRAVELLRDCRKVVVFTGAGVSTDSGIPDFRSPGGVWSRYDPRQFTYQRYVEEPETRRLAWQMRRELHHLRPRPNAAHEACVRLADRGRLAGVITQNIDGLHVDAGLGLGMVCEVHGTAREVVCLACGQRTSMGEAVARVEAGEDDPSCLACGGILKAATVSFGQALPTDVWARAQELTATCDAFIAAGSSLVVYPAADLPVQAERRGVPLVIINREGTPLDPIADAVCLGEVGELLPALVDALTATP